MSPLLKIMSHAERSCRKKITQKEIAIVILTSSRIEEFISATHYSLSSCRHRFRGSAATKRRRELTLSDPVWCHGLFLMVVRNPIRDDVRSTITLLQRSNISPRYRQAASSEICVFVRCTVVPTLYYFSAEIWELLYRLSCPFTITCEKRFFQELLNNNHNFIKKSTSY